MIATNPETGIQYATRAGPSVGAKQGLSIEGPLGYIYAQSGVFDESFRDPPSKVRDVQHVGTLNVSLTKTAAMMQEFAKETNSNRNSYLGFAMNSNSYAFTFVQSLGFQRPSPAPVDAPGWDNGYISKRLSYVPTK